MIDTSKPMVIGVVGLIRNRTRQSVGYFEELLQGILVEADSRDADVHVYRDNSWLWNGGVAPYKNGVSDGLILLSPVCRPEILNIIRSSNVPTVSVGESMLESGVPSIDIDNYGACKAATDHLIKLGHRRIGIITGRLGDEGWPRIRFAGYVDAIKQAGIDYDEALVSDVAAPVFDQGYDATCALFMRTASNPPTAVVAVNDNAAIGAITRLKELGLRVPEDVSVIGFDDMQRSAYLDPPLTTMRQPIITIGAKAVDVLFKLMCNPQMEPATYAVPAELIVRASTGPR